MYYLGIDGGGTKTHAVVVDDDGNIKGESTSNLANYHNIGIDKAITSVYTAASYAIRLAKIKISDIAATCVGIAAYDTPKDKVIITTAIQKAQHQFLGKNVKIVNDSVIGLFTGTKPPGVCLISGTGCNCYGIGPTSKEWFAGNWSYLMGDQGGGYHLALRIFRAVIKAFDGRGEPTILRELVLDQLGISDEFALVDWVYGTNPGPSEIASFGKLLDVALQKKDKVAQSIFNQHIYQLAINVGAVTEKVGLRNEKFDIVLIGSFFKTIGAVDAIAEKVKPFSPKINLVFPKVSPAIGATLLAKDSVNK